MDFLKENIPRMISVLYVDDEPALLEIAAIYLQAGGNFQVDTASSAITGLEKFRAGAYDAVISDYQMPGMDGIRFLKEIRAGGNTTPFILFTGKGREEVVIEAFNSGADFYLQKGGSPHAQFVELEHMISVATERKRTAEALRETQQRMADIINFLPDATFAIDRENRVLAWNRAMEEMTGIKKEAILGKGGYEYSVPFYGEKRPILVDLVLSRDEETGKRYPGLERKGDKIASELFAPNLYGGKGAYLWFSASPLCDTHGTVIGAIEAIRDITDHKSAEARLRASNAELSAAYEQLTAAQEELRQNYDELARSQQELQTSEERYRNVVEDQTEFICRFTPEGKLTFVNDAYCRYFGLDKRSCIGKPHSVVIPPEDLPLLKDHLKALSPENPVAIIEHRIVMPSGTVRWQRWSDRAIFDPGGRITEFQSVGRDTTDRVQVELSLQEAYRKLGILSSVTRHDILNTIDGLRTYLELSKQGLSDPKLLDFIHKEEQAAEAIQWQIEFTRNYQNIGAQAPGWQVLEEVIGSAIRQLDMPGVEIHTHVAGVEIFADPLVEKVFYNLMENSLRHGRHVTRMDYSVRETDRALLLTYRDNGVGISDGIRKKLFRKGFGSHTGLGLFLSREILSITGMTIRENGEHGRGARFEITIPKGVYRGKDGKPYREPASP